MKKIFIPVCAVFILFLISPTAHALTVVNNCSFEIEAYLYNNEDKGVNLPNVINFSKPLYTKIELEKLTIKKNSRKKFAASKKGSKKLQIKIKAKGGKKKGLTWVRKNYYYSHWVCTCPWKFDSSSYRGKDGKRITIGRWYKLSPDPHRTTKSKADACYDDSKWRRGHHMKHPAIPK